MKSSTLIESVKTQTEDFIAIAKGLKSYSMEDLVRRPSSNEWNVLECLAHLNRYCDFYLPAMQNAIAAQKIESEIDFKSGWIGGYMAKIILPKAKPNKMKAFAAMNPINSMIGTEEIDVFIKNQQKMISLLESATHISLTKTIIPTTISKFINMRLGDIFQFLANHTQRHMKQIENLRNGQLS